MFVSSLMLTLRGVFENQFQYIMGNAGYRTSRLRACCTQESRGENACFSLSRQIKPKMGARFFSLAFSRWQWLLK